MTVLSLKKDEEKKGVVLFSEWRKEVRKSNSSNKWDCFLSLLQHETLSHNREKNLFESIWRIVLEKAYFDFNRVQCKAKWKWVTQFARRYRFVRNMKIFYVDLKISENLKFHFFEERTLSLIVNLSSLERERRVSRTFVLLLIERTRWKFSQIFKFSFDATKFLSKIFGQILLKFCVDKFQLKSGKRKSVDRFTVSRNDQKEKSVDQNFRRFRRKIFPRNFQGQIFCSRENKSWKEKLFESIWPRNPAATETGRLKSTWRKNEKKFQENFFRFNEPNIPV